MGKAQFIFFHLIDRLVVSLKFGNGISQLDLIEHLIKLIDENKLSKITKKLNIKFKNINLLIQSLTHKSFNPSENNEKIEFLGDRILGLVIAQKLLKIYPDEKEGILDKKFASLVNKKHV